ncbi:MAG: hypothetical protein FJ279_35915, partial [Planctomycetes bacterium]|nr:hypothetical protein [Planctomycetota bacterium]
MTGSTFVEYDGLLRSDLTLTPRAKTTIEQLTLEIPLKPNWATLFHFWPGKWGSAYNSGALPPDGLSLPFKPFLWLGSEDGGLAWFMESDRGWSNADAKNVIEVKREKDAVVLRVRLIDKPTSVAEPLKYTVGFQATPVKPVPKDWHEWRVCHGASYGVESRPTRGSVALTYPALGRISLAQGTMEAWVTPTFDPQVKIENPASRGMYNREFFAVRLADGTIASLYWNIDDRGMRFYVKKGEQFPVLIGSHSDWKKDEPHHVALTWGAEARIYVDGRLLASKPFKGLLGDGNDQALDKAIIRFGGGLCDFILDEVRLSRVARADFDLTKPPAADAQTLLLDHLDGSVRGGTVDEGGAFVSAKFGQGLTLFLGGPPRTALDRAKERGVKTLVFHEHWTDIQNYTETTHEADLKRLVAACHERGIRLLLYFGYEMSNIAPEWPWYARECLTRSPDAPLPTKGGYHRQPEQYAFIVCYNSPWQDFLADGIQRVMDKYGVDGVYLDGTIEPWGCVNHRHGCGYQRPDGTWAPTYPIFAVRNLMKRLYAICSAKPGGMVNPHQSTCCTIPTLAFSHSYWDGEQFGSGEL